MSKYLSAVVFSIVVYGSAAQAGGGQPCHGRGDCPPTMRCLAPGEFPGCGTCFIGDGCQSDADCSAYGEGAICEQAGCACQPTCMLGCLSDSACGPGESCGADHRCAPSACSSDSDCPVNFGCVGPGDLHCARKQCAFDFECNGYCVNARCYDSLGACTGYPL